MSTHGSTRERILDEALDLFAQEGVAGTTITEIERRSGLRAGSGSLYRHFASKDDVFEAVVTREVTRLRESMEADRAARPRLDDPRDQLGLDLRLSLRHVARAEPLLRMLQQATGRTGDVNEIVRRVFALDAADGGWPVGDAAAPKPPAAGELDPLSLLVAVAALTGFHQLEQLQTGSFAGVDGDMFVDRLVDLLLPD